MVVGGSGGGGGGGEGLSDYPATEHAAVHVDHDFVDFRLLYHKILTVSECLPDVCEAIKEEELTPEWVARTGMQQPTCISHSGELLTSSSLDLDALSKALGVLDREVVTLDVSKQAPGPKWTLRQWCLYWRDRKVFSPDLQAALANPQQPLQHQQHTGSELAARLSASSSRGEEAGDMDDEADSAFVHQGDVDQFVDKEAPRKGIREASKRRLMALACLPIAEALKAQRRSGRHGALGTAAGTRAGAAGLPLSSAATVGVAGGPSPSISHGGEIGQAGAVLGASGSDPAGGAVGGPQLLQELEQELAVPPAILGADLLSSLALPGIAQQLPQRHYLALHPAGCVTNFQVNAGGATSWLRVLRGALVVVLVPPTEQNLQAYCSWVSYQARDKGLLLLDACSGALRAEVQAGGSLLVPGGWPYALVAKSDCLMVGAQLLHRHNLRLQLAAWEMEELLHVKARQRFPSFKHIMWHTAVHYSKLLRAAVGLPKSLRTRDQASAAHATASRNAATAAASLLQHAQQVPPGSPTWVLPEGWAGLATIGEDSTRVAHHTGPEDRGPGGSMLPPALRQLPGLHLAASGARVARLGAEVPSGSQRSEEADAEEEEDGVPLRRYVPLDVGSTKWRPQRQGGALRPPGGAGARGQQDSDEDVSGSEVGSWAMDGASEEDEEEEEDGEEEEEDGEEEEEDGGSARRASHLRASSRRTAIGSAAANRAPSESKQPRPGRSGSVRDWADDDDKDDAEEGDDGSRGGRKPGGRRGMKRRLQAYAEDGSEEEDDDPLGLRAAEEQSSGSERGAGRKRSRRQSAKQQQRQQQSRQRRRGSRAEMDDFIVEDEEEGVGQEAVAADSQEGSHAAPQRRSRRKASAAASRPRRERRSRPHRNSATRAFGRHLEDDEEEEEEEEELEDDGDDGGENESGGSTAAGGKAPRTHIARRRPAAPRSPLVASPPKTTIKLIFKPRPPPMPASALAAVPEPAATRAAPHVTLRLAAKDAGPGR